MLSYISSYLGSRPQAADSTHRAQQGFGVAGNSRLLQTEAQMWQVCGDLPWHNSPYHNISLPMPPGRLVTP